MGNLLDQVNNLVATETVQEIETDRLQNIDVSQGADEIERGAWENLFVSMERSFYNIVDLSATSIRKLSTLALEDEDARKQTGAGWIGRNAGKLAISFGEKAADPSLAPETDPETMDKFAELLGTTIPYTAAAIAGAGIGFVAGGPVGAGAAFAKTGAALTAFSIMREEAYRNAIDTGADEGTANIEANIVGGIQALLEMAQIGGILRQSKTGGVLLKSIVLNARNKAWTQVLKTGGKLSMSVVRNMAEEALQEALQGTTAELVPKLLRGKEIEPGFAGRRVREAVGGAIIGGMFGGIGSLAEIATGKGEAAHIPNRPEIEFDSTVETQAAEEFETEEEITGPTSDILSEGDIEFNEEVSEGETVSEAQIADAVVEGQEVESIVEDLSEPDTRSEAEQSIDKLNAAISSRVLSEIRKLTEIERSMQLGERVGKAEITGEKAKEEGLSIDAAQQAALGELRGEMVKANFPIFETNEVSPQDFENIRVAVWEKLKFFERTHALEAVNKLQDGLVPTEAEMKDLGKIIGKENADAIIEAAKGKLGKVQSFFINLINFPTTILASSEVSFIGRQGITTLPKWPKQWLVSLNANYKSFFSTEWADLAQVEMQTDEDFESFIEHGGFFAELGSDVTKQHERFHSEWAKQIPFFGALVRASERAAVVGPNKLRLGIYKFVKEQWAGLDQPTSEYQRLAKIVNISTGRGQVNNKRIREIMPYLNAGFFSPLYFKSRVDMIGETAKSLVDIATGNPNPTSKIMASQMLNFVLAGGLAMTIASVLGAKVERDPRSSDFGKIQLGRTRIDVWGGFQQIARSTAQLITGRSKAISSGEIFTKNRLETFGRFVQSKLSPVAGLGVELLSGKDFLGEPIPTFENRADLFEWAIFQKLSPLIIQDTVDVIRYSENKAALALTFPLAFHGIGVQTFAPNALDDLTQMRDHYSTRVFGKEWKDIGPLSQNALREYKPQIVEQENITKFERRNAPFDVKRQREAGVTVEKSLSREVRREMDSVAVSVGGLSRTIVRNWRLNADLYKKYQDDLSFLLNKVLPRIINRSGYQSQPPEVRQKILELIIKEAKSAVRKNIVLKANMKDIEDIREGVEQD